MHHNLGTHTQVSYALSLFIPWAGMRGSCILLAAPKSPGPKDFKAVVGAQAGVLEQAPGQQHAEGTACVAPDTGHKQEHILHSRKGFFLHHYPCL